MLSNSSVVGCFDQHSQTSQGVKALKRAGFNAKSLSILGNEDRTDDEITGYYNAVDRMKYWHGAGIPMKCVLQYELSVEAGSYMLVVVGTGEQVVRAKEILSAAGASDTHLHMTDPALTL